MSLIVERDAQTSRSPPPISPLLYSPATPSGAAFSPSVSLTLDSSFPPVTSYSNGKPKSSSPTAGSVDSSNGKTGSIKETMPASPVKLCKLSDFKELTYRGRSIL